MTEPLFLLLFSLLPWLARPFRTHSGPETVVATIYERKGRLVLRRRPVQP
jgi:hypothetical protein